MLKRIISVFLAAVLSAAVCWTEASACTEIYVGSGLTEDGSTILARSEDGYTDAKWPKVFDVAPEGAYRGGETYTGCYGFSWVFTHDSYGYTAFCDNNTTGVCPGCKGTHRHTPYQAAGTNSRGLSVTATETLIGKDAVLAVDPYNDESGIEEAEIPTVLLSEAASAREAMTLLTSIYADTGACGGSGVIVADGNEAWYIENLSGRQYIAVRLNADLLFVCPNISAIGLIDLNDRENVAASDRLIETAVSAGTFVGDAEAGLIDFAASYESSPDSAYCRLAAGLNFLSGSSVYPEDLTSSGIDGTAYRMTNVDPAGKTAALHTDIPLKDKLSVRDIMEFYRLKPISEHRNLETHIFQISDSTPQGTLEWVSMADNRASVFVPYYPMETTEVFENFHPVTAMPEQTEEESPEVPSYTLKDGQRYLFPENWKDSWYWVFTRLELIAREREDAAVYIREKLDALQDEICASGEAGNPAAEKVWQSVLELLDRF